MRDYPVEKLMRDARAMALIGGADERHTTAIAASLYQD
jgi:alkylation response protein AidB-like acyl-CoA dehydrogenase